MSEQKDLVVAQQRSRAPAPQQHSEVLAVLQMIERASKDPSVDVGKLEKLFELRERVRQQVARDEYVAALTAVQTTLPVIKTQGRIDYGKGKPLRYAKWEDINETIKPILAQHGFALSFRVGQAEGKITVTAVLAHVAGHTEETTIHLPADNSGGKGAVQGVGSTVSYGKRYTTAAILNLTWGGEDDDGNAGRFQPINAEQVEELTRALSEVGSSPEVLANAMGVNSLDELPQAKFENAKALIARKRKAA